MRRRSCRTGWASTWICGQLLRVALLRRMPYVMSRGDENPAPHKATAHLLTGGAFRVSRNSIYAGGTTGLLGLAVLLDTATGVAVVFLLGLLAHSSAVAEETYLEEKFGDEYREYRSRVRRLI